MQIPAFIKLSSGVSRFDPETMNTAIESRKLFLLLILICVGRLFTPTRSFVDIKLRGKKRPRSIELRACMLRSMYDTQ